MATVTTTVTDWRDGPFRLPAGHQELIVGDTHGCLPQLLALLAVARLEAPDSHLTTLGDHTDRGFDSIGTLRAAMEAVHEWQDRRGGGVALPGNHCQLLLGAMEDPEGDHADCMGRNGGVWAAFLPRTGETLKEAVRRELGDRGFGTFTQDGLLTRGGPGPGRARLHRRVGDVLMVHAGVEPNLPSAEAWVEGCDPMAIRDWHPLWIRDEFLEHKQAYCEGLAVVHGHTPEHKTRRADGTFANKGAHHVDGWRLGLDGGSHKTGIVTAAIIEDGQYRVVTARAA